MNLGQSDVNSDDVTAQPLSVLVVDDDPGLAEALVWGLKDRDVTVLAARSGAEARRMASQPVDFVVLDLMLPDETGLDIAECFVGSPFVLISGFLQTRTTVRAMQLGAVDVLEKPVDLTTLTSIIASALDRRVVPAPAQTPARLTPVSNRPVALIWAESVVRACSASRDLSTVTAWARHVGVSRSTLAEQSRILGVSARAGRAPAPGRRARGRAAPGGCAPPTPRGRPGRRTLAALLARMGFEDGGLVTVPVEQFLSQQRLVPAESDALEAVRRVAKSLVA